MNKVEQFQKSAQEHNEAAVALTNTLAASFKTITTAHAEYAKKLLQDGSEFFSKLTKLNSTDEAMELQNDYAKSAYEAFITESKKFFELYSDLARQTLKPFEGLIAKLPPAKQQKLQTGKAGSN
jgi:hypothetical protein